MTGYTASRHTPVLPGAVLLPATLLAAVAAGLLVARAPLETLQPKLPVWLSRCASA